MAKYLLGVAAGMAVTIAATPLVPAFSGEKPRGARAPQNYLMELDWPPTPSDILFRHSYHIRDTGVVVRGDRVFLAVTAPSRRVLDAFLEGAGQETAKISPVPVRWTGDGFVALPAADVAGSFAAAAD